MIALTVTISALLVAFVVHLILWRWRLPRAQLKVLLVIFFLIWAFVSALLLTGAFGILVAIGVPFVGFLYFCLIYWSAAFCYVITYSAMEGDSPTLSLTRHLHRKGEEGFSHKEIETFFR
jgi:hypothetical protein